MYDATQWLVDRANIHDVVIAMLLYADIKQTEKIASDVFAEQISVDYTSILGGEPYTISGGEQAAMWKAMQVDFDALQHTTLSPLIDLGQPNAAEPPSTASVLVNTGVTLVRDAAEGGPILQIGGRYELELTRTSLEGCNPWRISKMKAVNIWMNGNKNVMIKQDDFETPKA
ncbi:hypothetical protein BD626DRAFT_483634 [Schizophyllum amplum]|uniref:SnoaL-like domain-containing protein n=1 Tax=Schizophyllum amplum TaxID=97359 RepID=A0A550CPN9_9AGAR|nr:hypothetical protein BD626DRAFT_483634 [Auriculariopsis ampla]